MQGASDLRWLSWGGLMHRFGDQPRTYYSQIDRLSYSEWNKTMGVLVINRQMLDHFLRAYNLKTEKSEFSQRETLESFKI